MFWFLLRTWKGLILPHLPSRGQVGFIRAQNPTVACFTSSLLWKVSAMPVGPTTSPENSWEALFIPGRCSMGTRTHLQLALELREGLEVVWVRVDVGRGSQTFWLAWERVIQACPGVTGLPPSLQGPLL